MEEFTRPFTEEEFDKAFRESGYPEIARRYCREKWEEKYAFLISEYVPEDDSTDVEKLLTELKEQEDWTSDNVREEAWSFVVRNEKVNVYVDQRQHGNSHEWAVIFCEHCDKEEDSLNSDTYAKTYKTHRKLHKADEGFVDDKIGYVCVKAGIKSDPEIRQAVKYLAKGEGELVGHYIGCGIFDGVGKNVNELFNEAVYYKELCEQIMAEGYDKETAIQHADNLIGKIDYPIYKSVYKEAMAHGATPDEAHRLADCCENHSVNAYFDLEWREFMKEFTEPWQREIYARLTIDEIKKSEGGLSTLHENEIRASLGLSPIDKPLTYEDQEFIRLKKKYLDNGQNEYLAEKRAYEEVYGDDINSPLPHGNRARDFNREILHSMFPDDDVDSEDFEDGIDMEDFSRD